MVIHKDALKVGGALTERRRRYAEKRLSKRVFLESPFLLCHLIRFSDALRVNLKGAESQPQRGNGLSKNNLLDNRSPHDAFSAPLARALKGDGHYDKATDPNLRFPVVSAVSYVLHMLEFPGEWVNLRRRKTSLSEQDYGSKVVHA